MVFAVSMSADAGQEAASGASFAPLPLRAPAPPAVLVPAQPPALGIDFGKFPGGARKVLREASLSIGGGEEFRQLVRDITLQIASAHPQVVAREQVPPAVKAKEEEIAREQVKNKPPQAIAKIVEVHWRGGSSEPSASPQVTSEPNLFRAAS
jgi:hypothetical protein